MFLLSKLLPLLLPLGVALLLLLWGTLRHSRWPTQPQLPPEGDVLLRRARSLGIPASDLASTARVSNTAEEARLVASQLPTGSSVVLVTSAFHMPRARRLFERAGLQVLPYHVDFKATGAWAIHLLADPLNHFPSADGLEGSSRALREALSLNF